MAQRWRKPNLNHKHRLRPSPKLQLFMKTGIPSSGMRFKILLMDYMGAQSLEYSLSGAALKNCLFL